MRERLYKAKRLDNGEWVYGFYLHQRKSLTDNEEHYILTNNGFGFSWNKIDEKTLCEYVKDDCKGNQVFENDIVKIDYTDLEFGLIKITGQIMWNKEIGGYIIHETAYCRNYDIRYHDEMEVVGNAFDRPNF